MNETTDKPELSEHELIALRRAKLTDLREQGQAFPNDFQRDVLAACLHATYDEKDNDALSEVSEEFHLAGRMMTRRIMGKASFIDIKDMSGRMQVYVTRDELPEGVYQAFKKWDLGDILGVSGKVFKTKTGELTIKATSIRLLTKSLRPLPDKYHGLSDQEACYRKRYLDLMVNEKSRKTFQIRSKLVSKLREYFAKQQFLEVETPMMQAIPGGAAARPFTTHHNTLDMPLFMRIAPELYLKRLVVGGFERVFEINRNFRNEGMSTQHNPEFTMLEFYMAYATYFDMMDFTEDMFRWVTEETLGSAQFTYQGREYDFAKPFARLSVRDSILQYNDDISADDIDNLTTAKAHAERLGIQVKDSYGLGKIQIEIFDKTVEHRLLDPTFITEYPTEVSPLARRNNERPEITDRFELFIAGREIANAFSELNDAEDQAERFQAQVREKEAGDDEAMHYDADYVEALEYGLPPTAGEGVGIDRLAMLLTDSASIRDVILFPLMRRQQGQEHG